MPTVEKMEVEVVSTEEPTKFTKNFEVKTVEIVGFDEKLSMLKVDERNWSNNMLVNNNINNGCNNNSKFITGPPCEGLTRFYRAYRLESKIGSGGFGSVYSAVRLTDDTRVAVKHIRKNKIANFTGSVAPLSGTRWYGGGPMSGRQPSEISLHARCSHIPGVVSLIDYYETIDSYLMVLERPPSSRDLFDYVTERGRLGEPVARRIFHQVIEAVVAMHRAGVVHRDIKDENVLVNTSNLDVKIVDFGSAALLKDSPYTQLQGTKVYSPPEWISSKSYTADGGTVWSLGILLYDLLCGDVPFEQDNQILAAELHFQPNLVISKECEDLIRNCLCVDVSKRLTLEEVSQHIWLRGAGDPLERIGHTALRAQDNHISTDLLDDYPMLPAMESNARICKDDHHSSLQNDEYPMPAVTKDENSNDGNDNSTIQKDDSINANFTSASSSDDDIRDDYHVLSAREDKNRDQHSNHSNLQNIYFKLHAAVVNKAHISDDDYPSVSEKDDCRMIIEKNDKNDNNTNSYKDDNTNNNTDKLKTNDKDDQASEMQDNTEIIHSDTQKGTHTSIQSDIEANNQSSKEVYNYCDCETDEQGNEDTYSQRDYEIYSHTYRHKDKDTYIDSNIDTDYLNKNTDHRG